MCLELMDCTGSPGCVVFGLYVLTTVLLLILLSSASQETMKISNERAVLLLGKSFLGKNCWAEERQVFQPIMQIPKLSPNQYLRTSTGR